MEGFGSKYQASHSHSMEQANGFLRSYRGKHSGAHSKLRENQGESNATFVPNYFKSKADVETAKKHTQRELMVSLIIKYAK